MADCNIRNLNAELVQRVKLAAVRDNMTMREWVIVAFERELHREEMELLTYRTTKVESEYGVGDGVVHVASAEKLRHADNCKCFICKPPNEE